MEDVREAVVPAEARSYAVFVPTTLNAIAAKLVAMVQKIGMSTMTSMGINVPLVMETIDLLNAGASLDIQHDVLLDGLGISKAGTQAWQARGAYISLDSLKPAEKVVHRLRMGTSGGWLTSHGCTECAKKNPLRCDRHRC